MSIESEALGEIAGPMESTVVKAGMSKAKKLAILAGLLGTGAGATALNNMAMPQPQAPGYGMDPENTGLQQQTPLAHLLYPGRPQQDLLGATALGYDPTGTDPSNMYGALGAPPQYTTRRYGPLGMFSADSAGGFFIPPQRPINY